MGSNFRNLNHTAPGPCYASTSVLESQYPLPPPVSSEEGHTGETSAGSGDSSSGATSGDRRVRRSRGRESRGSHSNSGSDSSGRGTEGRCTTADTRLVSSVTSSPYHRPPPGPPPPDPGLPPIPPLRGLSSYQVSRGTSMFSICDPSCFLCGGSIGIPYSRPAIQGVRAGSFNSFGVGSGYCSGGEGMGGSHYSVPGLLYGRQVSVMLESWWIFAITWHSSRPPGVGAARAEPSAPTPTPTTRVPASTGKEWVDAR